MFLMRKLLLRRLHERYPINIPVFIKDRFNIECEYHWISDKDIYTLLYYTIMKAAKAAGQPVWNCSFGSGSFLFYLLDKGLNPLEPHWECRGCGRIETEASAELCFDLPVKVCPACKTYMARDGIHCSAEVSLWHKGLEIRVNEEFLEASSQAALSMLRGHRVFRRYYNHNPGPANSRSFYFVDKENLTEKSFIHQEESGFEYINIEDEKKCTAFLRSIVIKAQKNNAMPKNALSMEEWIESKPDIQSLLQRQIYGMKVQGDYFPENLFERIQQMIDLLQPDTWTSLIETFCYSSGNYSRTGKYTPQEKAELIRRSTYRHALYSRESLQFYLQKEGIPVIMDWQMVDQLRTGRKGFEMEIYKKKTPLLEQDELFQSISYLWSRTYAINWLWRYHE